VTDGRGRPVKEKTGLEAGEEFLVRFPSPWPPHRLPESRPLQILYEDDCVLAVNKPPLVVLHPAKGNRENTLFHALLHYLGEEEPVRFVHRLDRETSGVVLVAKNRETARRLGGALREGRIARTYIALACGTDRVPGDGSGREIEGAIKRSADRPERGIMRVEGKRARTYVRSVAVSPSEGYTLFRILPVTGRTHQIRIHLAGTGFPLAGDSLYSPCPWRARKELGLRRAALHAWKISYPHPGTEVVSPVPDDLRTAFQKLGIPFPGGIPGAGKGGEK